MMHKYLCRFPSNDQVSMGSVEFDINRGKYHLPTISFSLHKVTKAVSGYPCKYFPCLTSTHTVHNWLATLHITSFVETLLGIYSQSKIVRWAHFQLPHHSLRGSPATRPQPHFLKCTQLSINKPLSL